MNDGTIGTWSYRAGNWFAVFGSTTTLLLPESERERVVGLWAEVDGGAEFHQVLDGLLASGLSSLPGFVLVDAASDGPTRILLRGEGVRAELTTDDETVELEGAATSTWVERNVDGVTALSVTLGEAGDSPDLPIDAGLVRVSRIDLPPAGQDEAEPDPEPDAGAGAGLGAAAEVDTVPPAAVVAEPLEEPSPIEADSEDVVAPEPSLSSRIEPWPEPAAEPEIPAADTDTEHTDGTGIEADPPTEHLPLVPPPPPPPPPSWGDIPPPPPAQPGPWGDGGPAESLPPPPPGPPPGAIDSPVVEEVQADSDHDGLTQAGAVDEPVGPEQPGIPGQPMAPPVTSSVAKLVISSGETVDVDRVVLIGRAPEARRFTSTDQPTLVTVPSPMHEISSTHVEVRPGSGADHGSAVVTDMGSTNGTVLVQPGLPPEDLKPGIAVQLIPGAIINLGDGLTIQVTRP